MICGEQQCEKLSRVKSSQQWRNPSVRDSKLCVKAVSLNTYMKSTLFDFESKDSGVLVGCGNKKLIVNFKCFMLGLYTAFSVSFRFFFLPRFRPRTKVKMTLP